MLNQEELLKKKEIVESLTESFKQAEKDVIVLKTKIEASESKREELNKECEEKFGCKPEELPQLISNTSDDIEKLVKEIESTFGNVTPVQESNQTVSDFNMFENEGDVSNGSF